jgi:hypothetical protein
MFNASEEIRYPWINAADFWAGAYWTHLGAIHLVLATFFICYLCCNIFLRSNLLLEFRCAILYCALTVFNNPAFNLFGLNLNEIFGLTTVLVVGIKGKLLHGRNSSPAAIGLFVVFMISIIHVLFTTLIYPDLAPNFITIIKKIAVNVKILVLAINLVVIGAHLKRGLGLNILIRSILLSGTFALMMYVVQILLVSIGAPPYGTYIDAGFTGLASFGSVSIERGHFGKFMAPYFPFFLYALIKWKAKWRFILYLVITAINFSASSIFFFICSMFLMGVFFYRSLDKRRLMLALFIIISLSALLLLNLNVYQGIIEKIITVALQGSECEGCGRNFSLFMDYIKTYPFGMGYSGSTLRTAPYMPELNAAYFAFVAQYSLLALPILLGFGFLLFRAIRFGAKNLLYRCFNVGVCMAPIIFFTDILWFVPLIWLSIEMNLSVKESLYGS